MAGLLFLQLAALQLFVLQSLCRVTRAPAVGHALGRRQIAISALDRTLGQYPSRSTAPRDVAPPDPDTLIGTLWRENHDLVDEFLNVEFVQIQAEGQDNETLPSYQYYSVQDYFYLIDYIQYKALRMTTYSELDPSTLLSVMAEETESINDDVDYAWSFRNETLVTDLGIPPEFIDDRGRATEEIAYADWLQKNLDLGWFTLHVMSIPCIYGWVQLASKFNELTTTNRDTLFYRTWIEVNADPSYGQALSDFLEANKEIYYSLDANKTWTGVFREALRFEIDFFKSAVGKTLEDLPTDV
ncbi:hypothetical protein F4778DRAFT_800166 [Xylariomycetidae sp. FL2044]|nr:hypothetical protein F4778DRAFT_800166 [Xylariomycetidae sp. FL2044]